MLEEIKSIPIKQLYLEAMPLLEKMWQEVGMAGTLDLELDIDIDRYEAMEEAGGINCLAYFKDSKIIGFIVLINYVLPQHCSTLFSVSNTIYIDNYHRSPKAAHKLLREAERVAKESGVDYMIISSNSNSPISTWLQRSGYTECEVNYCKAV